MNSDLEFKYLLKKGIGVTLVQGISMILLFVLNWYLARKLGAHDYGVFTYALSWVYLFGTLSLLGLNVVIQREVIKYSPNKIRRLISFSRRVNFLVTLGILLLFTAIIYFFLPQLNDELYRPLLLTILMLPVFGQLLLNKAVCIGLKKVIHSQLPEEIIRPLLMLLGCIVLWQFFTPSVESGIWLFMSALFVAFLCSIFYAHYAIPKHSELNDDSDQKDWMKLGFRFFILTAAVIINSRADLLMLGLFNQTDQVGIYNIATKLSAFVGLALLLLNKVLTPYISKHIETDKEHLNAIIKKFIRLIFFLSVLICTLFYFLGNEILQLFGTEFQVGYWALLILSLGQLLNVLVGPVGHLLTMTKFEKISVNIMIISTLINIILNLALIPAFGMNGAAIATAISLAIWNVIHFVFVKRKLNMNPSIV